MFVVIGRLAWSLDKTGEPGQALLFGEEIVDILRRATTRFGPGRCINWVAISLIQGTPNALRAADEALQLYRLLDIAQPGSFALQMDSAMHNRTLFLNGLERHG
ncbi:hypothetical protein [Nocardia sp. NPDC004722]